MNVADARLVTYSTMRDARIATLVSEASSPDTEVLQRIQQALDKASTDYAARHYQDAVADYKQASALIWTQLDPGTKPGLSGIWKYRYDPQLFSTMLQASLGWLGVLVVPDPTSPVGPPSPDPIEPDVLDRIGLSSEQYSSPQSLAAAASAKLAEIYAAQGSTTASATYQELAMKQDPTVAGAILGTQTGPILNRGEQAQLQDLTLQDLKVQDATMQDAAVRDAAVRDAVRQPAPTAPGGLAPDVQLAQPDVQLAKPDVPLAQPEVPLAQPEVVAGVQRLNTGVSRLIGVPVTLTQQRSLQVLSGTISADAQTASFTFQVGSLPDHTAIEAQLYGNRVHLTELPDILAQPLVASDLVLSLPHTYYFVIPMGLGDCYAAIGDWANAESSYLTAAAYAYLNQAVEAPQLWAKLAALYVDWADSLYRGGDPASALPIYDKVVTQAGAAPSSALYTTGGIAPGAQIAQTIISALPQLIADPVAVAHTLNPTIATPIVNAYIKLGQIKAGLDFYGHWAPVVPIWTFDYLQQVANQYCQYALTTEQNVISYWDRADQAQLTRLQLSQHVADSQAEVSTAQQQLAAAQAEAAAYQSGLDLANLRAQDAQQNADSYQALQSQVIQYSASSSEVSGGDNGNPDYLNSLADQLMSGQSITGDRGDIAAATQLVSSRLSMQYEVGSLQRTAAEMQAAAGQAQAELAAANARATAASGQVALAQLHANEAQAVLDAFDDATFTAGVWKAMGDRLYDLYRRYLGMALRTAKLMQRAYNFENDADLTVIRADYSTDEIRGLLAADMLMADVASFTDTLLTNTRSKVQPVTHTLSVAQRHSYLFETQFRKTGTISFDTTADDFDLAYPGTYGGRIRHVEVALQGLTPTSGVSGTLTCGGLSFYRTPTDSWTGNDSDHMRRRVQTAETLVISDFDRRTDPALAAGDNRQSGIFAGAGVIGNWTLSIPPEVNDIDYNLITDVLITFTYDVRYDPQLATTVKQLLASQPGAHTTQIGIPLRWLYPDTFFDLVNNHTATLRIAPSDLPLNQTATKLTQLGLLVTTGGGHSPSALALEIIAPGAAAASSATTDASGLVTSTSAGSPLGSQLGQPVIGDWTFTVPAAANPTWQTDGTLDLTALANATLLLEYSYTPRSGG